MKIKEFFDTKPGCDYHCAAMSSNLPKTLDPRQYAKAARQLQGEIKLAGMGRLAELVLDNSALARLSLQFDLQQNRPQVSGRLQTQLIVRCQRCLGELEIDVDRQLNLLVVGSETDVTAFSREQDMVLLGEEGTIDLAELVEDELIMELPDFPVHPQGECQAGWVDEQENATVDEPAQTHRPFAVLEKLKN